VVLPSRMTKMSSTYVCYVSALGLIRVVLFSQDLQQEFCQYAGYWGGTGPVILRPTFVVCFEVVLLHGEF
jgi:hypothetical protein